MKIAVIFFLCILAWTHSLSYLSRLNEDWRNFKLTYGKQYHSAQEETKRMKIFMENAYKIIRHNRLYALGKSTFTMKMNKFGDMDSKEFDATMKGLKTPPVCADTFTEDAPTFIPPANIGELPATFDWRRIGGVTPIKDQGFCGSCWSFSAAGALEGQLFRKTGKTISLSEQNLIDCTFDYGNDGCFGGFMTNAYDYVKVNKGIDTEEGYPYEHGECDCRYNASYFGVTDYGYTKIEYDNEDALQAAIATVGPISVGIDATGEFQFYGAGVYNNVGCSKVHLDHAVLAIGYNITHYTSKWETQDQYWIIKNSWGTDWGMDGYGWMVRNCTGQNNQCGIVSLASYPIV